MSLSGISAPKTLPMTPNAPEPVPVAAGIAGASAALTVRSAKFLFSPKYMLLVQGIKAMCDDTGPLKGLGTFIGGLMILASPAWFTIRTVVALPGMALGAVGTLASGLVWGAQSAAQKVQGPSEADKKREELTKQFVKRMQDILSEMPYPRQMYCKEHLDQLISIAFLTVGFLSRNEEGKALRVGGDLLRARDIARLDDTRKGYFNTTCEIKDALRSLLLSNEDEHAWRTLLGMIEKPPEDQIGRETIELLTGYISTLGEAVTEDEVFKKIWSDSLNT